MDDEIVGGRAETRYSPVGYLALEQDATGARFTFFCSATLIAPRIVVTAAHCVAATIDQVRPAGPWMSFSTGPVTASARRPMRVKVARVDPGYAPDDPQYFANHGFEHDFAALVLETAVTDVRPARIADGNATRSYRAVGYGRTKTGPFDLVEPGPQVRKSLGMKLLGGTPTTHYRVAPTNGSVCYGDSGGPLVESAEASDGTRDTTTIGVLASFLTTSAEETCVRGTEALYSSLSAHRGFLDEIRAHDL